MIKLKTILPYIVTAAVFTGVGMQIERTHMDSRMIDTVITSTLSPETAPPVSGSDAPAAETASASDAALSPVPDPVPAAAAQDSGGKIDINTATIEELDTLAGIGETTAQKIIDDRAANGPYKSIEDIMRVSGIGEKKFAAIKDSIKV